MSDLSNPSRRKFKQDHPDLYSDDMHTLLASMQVMYKVFNERFGLIQWWNKRSFPAYEVEQLMIEEYKYYISNCIEPLNIGWWSDPNKITCRWELVFFFKKICRYYAQRQIYGGNNSIKEYMLSREALYREQRIQFAEANPDFTGKKKSIRKRERREQRKIDAGYKRMRG